MKPTFNDRIPIRLQKEDRKVNFKFHALADHLGVNVRYIYDLLKRGREPTNPVIRKKLFLPKHPRRPKTINPQPLEVRWWRRQSKEYRRSIILSAYKKENE